MTVQDSRHASPGGHGSGRSRLYLMYFALAAFDLLAVSLGLYLIDRLTSLHTESVQVSQVWGQRLDDYVDLMRMAAEVNAPGNDVFNSRDVAAESARLETSRAAFEKRAAELRDELSNNVDSTQAATLLGQFDRVAESMDRMVVLSRRIMESFEQRNPENAGEHMALMDRQYVAVVGELGKLGVLVRALQQSHFDSALAAASRWRKLEFAIAGLIIVMVVSVTFYGNLLAKRLRESAQRTERLVQQRTGELQRTHQKLRQADRLAAIGTLAAGLGHDMNNVLLPTRARLDALDASQLPDSARDQLLAVRRSLAYLQQLSDGLYLLALDPDDLEASAGRVKIDLWWPHVLPLLKSAVPTHVKFEQEVTPGLPEVQLQPHRLTQALLNLVVNAAEAVREHGVIRVSIAPSHDGRSVVLAVRDNGEGMSDDVREHAMDPFYTTKKRGLGTGLGLSLVHGVAQSAGGSMRIDSAPGQGTSVTLTLPCATTATSGSDHEGGVEESRCVAISIADRRAASYIGSMVKSAGCEPQYLNGESDQANAEPAECRVWIAEPSAARLPAARQFIRADRRRRVITFGAANEDWNALGAAAIANPEDSEAIRRIITATLRDIRGEPAS